MQAAIHLPTPGSPAYALAKLGAVGGVIALKMALSRRARRQEEPAAEPGPAAESRSSRPHPVSARKARRRGRKRR
jgi:hypothetical protein